MKRSFFLVSLAVLFTSSIPAHASWHWTHGTSGHLQDESGGAAFTRLGSGLQVDVQGASSTWIHYAVPTDGDTGVGAQYVKIRFNPLHAVDSRIQTVRLYNGAQVVKTFTVSWNTLGAQTKTLNIGSVTKFNFGMGVSLELTGGPDSGIDQFVIHGVGADFIPIP